MKNTYTDKQTNEQTNINNKQTTERLANRRFSESFMLLFSSLKQPKDKNEQNEDKKSIFRNVMSRSR